MASTMFRHRAPDPARGFTLIELMIAVAIIALLAAIAYPSYQDSIWKAKRAEAKAAIFKALQAEERFYTQNNTYVTYTTPAPSGAFPIFSADNVGNSRYTIEVRGFGAGLCGGGQPDAGRCVVVVAIVVGNPDPICGATLQADTIGNKTSSTADARCWR